MRKKLMVSVYATPLQKEKLKYLADKEGVSQSKYLLNLIDREYTSRH